VKPAGTGPLELPTARLSLRTLGPRDARDVYAYQLRNRDFLSVWEPERQETYYSVRGQRILLTRSRRAAARGTELSLWIFRKEDRRLIGNITFSNIIRGCFQSCFLGYKLDVNQVRQGYMTEALATALAWLFQEWGLHRVEANILPENEGSIRVVEKLGFEYEGTSREYLKIRGVWRDHCHYVLLNRPPEESSGG